MKMKKIFLMLSVSILVISMMAMSFADAPFGPASIFASLTNQTTQEAHDLKVTSGKTYGELAKDANVYDAFAEQTLAAKTDRVNSLVASGELTQTEADEILAALANCDGSSKHILRNYLKSGSHPLDGTGNGLGRGMGNGMGRGMGRGNK